MYVSPQDEAKAKLIAEGCIDVRRLKTGVKVTCESSVGTLINFELLDEKSSLVLMYSTDNQFRGSPPKRALFRESWSARQQPLVIPGCIVKHMRAMFEFADAKYLTEPIVTALVEGDGWHYEVFK